MAAATEAQIESGVESTYDAASLPAAIITRAFGTISNVGGTEALNASRGEMGVLGYLASHDNVTTPSKLIDALGVSSARVANALKTLERKGYIVRETNPDDGRSVIVRLTPEGRAYGDANFEAAVAHLGKLLSPLSEAEQIELARLVEKMARPLVR